MPVKVFFKFIQHGIGNSIGVARICWRSVIVRQFTDLNKAITLILMILHHHSNWIFNCSKSWRSPSSACFLCFFHFFDLWEEHEFFFFHMGSQVTCGVLEVLLNFIEIWMRLTTYFATFGTDL